MLNTLKILISIPVGWFGCFTAIIMNGGRGMSWLLDRAIETFGETAVLDKIVNDLKRNPILWDAIIDSRGFTNIYMFISWVPSKYRIMINSELDKYRQV